MEEYSSAYIHWDDERQKASLADQLGTAKTSVITLEGADIGWLALQETDSSMLLGHFYIEPRFQNRGIGSTILSRVLAEATAKSKPVELAVLKNNPARRLYERSGFVVVSEDDMKYFMRRSHGL
jgi:GNAT superfamily N-acetyltransferase